MPTSPNFGAFVISLDFELLWGVRDSLGRNYGYRPNLFGARVAIPEMLKLFEAFQVGVTWATVGMLFARDKRHMEARKPSRRPSYTNPLLDPYLEPIGDNHEDDPLHFATDLIKAIQRTPRQEIATHTFSHYYCLAEGQTLEQFSADIASAVQIAADHEITLRSIVFPRNQCNPSYLAILRDHGITTYRGNLAGRIYSSEPSVARRPEVRAGRLLDAYIPISRNNTSSWASVHEGEAANVPASAFLRPCSQRLNAIESLRLGRIRRSMEVAARTGRIYHIWWHPHNFGVNLQENLRFLEQILICFTDLQRQYGMRSLTMAEVSDLAPVRQKAAATFAAAQ